MAFDIEGEGVEQLSEAKSKALKEIPDASGWSEAMDALLLLRRVDKNLPWRAVAPIGAMNARRCQSRLKVLQARTTRSSEPAAAEVKTSEPRDGLAWLVKKHRLNGAQHREAMLYRQGFCDAGEVTMRSCLDVGVGGRGSVVGLPDATVLTMTQARRDLFVARFQVLRGQVDMLTVMDGVCGHGYTLRYLAGGDRHRADVLEVALKLALDLLVAFRAGPPAGLESAA